MFFAFSCNNFQLLETKKAAPEKWKTAKKIDLISYLNDIDQLYHKTVDFSSKNDGFGEIRAVFFDAFFMGFTLFY